MTTAQDALNALKEIFVDLYSMECAEPEATRKIHIALLRLAELEKRLEINPDAPAWDGIECRNETIRMLQSKVDKMEKAAEGMAGVIRDMALLINEGCIDGEGREVKNEYGAKIVYCHEEWEHYAKQALAAYRKIKGEKE